MEIENHFSNIASLLGEKVRSVMLWCLLDGRAYTATELAVCANISAQSASNHLSKLVEANILSVQKQGRHRYFTFASPQVAQVIEGIAGLISNEHSSKRFVNHVPSNLRLARTCYDHLAGKLAVDITEALQKDKILVAVEKQYIVSEYGKAKLFTLGLDADAITSSKRSFAHQCLDWSERKHHVAGALGAALLEKMLQKDWIRRTRNSREIFITPKGKMELKENLGIEV